MATSMASWCAFWDFARVSGNSVFVSVGAIVSDWMVIDRMIEGAIAANADFIQLRISLV